MISKKKGIKGLKIYRDHQIENDCVLLPFKGTDKIPEELIANKVPKWCEPGDPLNEFLAEQIKKKHGNSGVIFCPYVPSVFTKDPEKEEK